MKYILVTGGVISGIGKGVVASSIGALLKACNLKVTAIKIDPYINIDAGTFSPLEHGEVFVLDDGCEVDLDLGNYERFLGTNLCNLNNITTGKIYQQVINRERQGDYLGKTVQIIPHITDAIQEWIENAAKIQHDGHEADVCIIELGGTVGDIESMPFIEALRQLQRRVKRENFCCCHVNLVPRVGKEYKSKPTQASIAKIFSLGIHPDLIVCRSETPIGQSVKDKISLFCDVEPDSIFNLPDMKHIYQVPIELQKQGIIKTISSCLKVHACACDRLEKWKTISDIAVNAEEEILIALVGKYTDLDDSYASVTKALEHACYSIGARPKIRFINSSLLEDNDAQAWKQVKTSHCMIVPGGFGIRGVEGKIRAIKYARERGMPFLGICLGFQLAVIEYARNFLGLSKAHSNEFAEELKNTEFEPIVIEMLEYKDPESKMGGTMRLGLRKTLFVNENSFMREKYGGKEAIEERHRHRYEINPKYTGRLEKDSLKFVGKNEDGTRMEILELDRSVHPYFVGVQYHPEYLSRPFKPSPPYQGLVEAAKCQLDSYNYTMSPNFND